MRNRLIQLEQIEHGTEILELIKILETKIDELGKANQYITNSRYIYAEKSTINKINQIKLVLNEEYIKQLKEEIVDTILNIYNEEKNPPEPVCFGVIQDILLKLEILLNRETLYKKITDGLTIREKTELNEIIQIKLDEEIARITIDLKMDLQDFILEQVKAAEDRINTAISTIDEKVNNTNIRIGELNGLHPFIKEALGVNLTVKDAINFLFQLNIDMYKNIKKINNALGDNKVDLENSYNKDLPNSFILPADLSEGENELGEVSENLKLLNELQTVDNTTENEEDNFGSIAEMIKYRKTLNNLDGGDK